MERSEWLKQMRQKTQALYDRFAPLYWVKYGLQPNETHSAFLQTFLDMVPQNSTLLSAGCGAGRYDGILSNAGHNIVGIDLSAGMLARAREKFPEIRYKQIGLQEMDFQAEFNGAICIDALEHVFPEDWPVIVAGFANALKPGGVLYFTLDVSAMDWLQEAYEQANSQGLPVVFGEVAAEIDEAYEQVMSLPLDEVPGELSDKAVYHFYPSVEQVKKWLDKEGFVVETDGMGKWYRHFVVRKT
jgi:SAM-dependent methyltransferase